MSYMFWKRRNKTIHTVYRYPAHEISYLVKDLKVKNFKLYIHPYVAAFINKGFPSLKWQWKWRYGMGVKIIPNQNLAFLEYHFMDENGEEIDMKQDFEVK
jgi:hypothetical protein